MTERTDVHVGTREELLTDLEAALVAEQLRAPAGHLQGLAASRSSRGSGHVRPGRSSARSRRLPAEREWPSGFYYRPRKDELCGLIEGSLRDVERALLAASTALNERLQRKGLSLGFGAAVLPDEAGDPIGALALADSRVARVSDGEPLPRGGSPADSQARSN